MNAFESVIASLLEHEGFWTKLNYKVELTKDDKKNINRPSSPRWEIDVIGYQPQTNILRVVECKSFLDSGGVKLISFDRGISANTQHLKLFKLFNEDKLREIVFDRLSSQLVDKKLCNSSPKIELWLAAGKIYQQDVEPIKKLFSEKGWFLWTPEDIRERTEKLVNSGYDDSTVTIVSKLLKKK
ncbi:MAG: hypothetical protein ABFD14_12150 [Anaerolineaceae bacterium]